MSEFRTSLAVALMSILGWSLSAQPPQEKPASSAQAKEVANVNEVLVDIVARDKKGKLIRDLRPEEIEITDDGNPVKLGSLRFVTGQAGQAAAGESANPGAKRPVRLVALVFERVNRDAAKLARETAYEMLKSESGADLYYAVLLVDRRLRMVQNYTKDRTALQNAIDTVTLGAKSHTRVDLDAAEANLGLFAQDPVTRTQATTGNVSNVAGVDQQMASMMAKSLQDSEQIVRDMQTRPSLGAMLALVQHQGTLPGRKSLVYFSEGLPLTSAGKYMLRSVVAAANRSGVSLYTVDVTGVAMESRTEAGRLMLQSAAQASNAATQTVGGMGSSSPGIPGGAPAGVPAGASPSMSIGGSVMAQQVKAGDRVADSTFSDAQGTLVELAKTTGGFFIGDSNDLRRPARRMIEDIASYYEASYALDSAAYDGRFHPLGVTVKRPGVAAQSRSGYVALPPGTPPDTQPFELALMRFLAAPELPRGLEVRSDITRFGQASRGVTASLVIELPLGQFEFREDTNSRMFEVHPTLLALLKDKSGRIVQKFSQDLPYRGALEAMDRMKEGAYTFQRTFTAEPGEYVLDLAVNDGIGGKVTALRKDVAIPDAPRGTGLSQISLVQRFESMPESGADNDPYRYEKARVVPSLRRTISTEKTKALSLFFVMYPDPGAGAAKPALEMEVLRAGESLGVIPMEWPKDARPGAVPYIASIPCSTLRPGDYEIRAVLKQGAASVSQTAKLTLDGPEPVAAAAAPEQPAGGDASPADTVQARAPLTIKALGSGTRPADEDIGRIIEYARKRSLEYSDVLPNFTCLQVTRRSVSKTGPDNFSLKDNITELLRYQDHREMRQLLDVNGQKTDSNRHGLGGVLSSGEFGVLLKAVFEPEAKAEFSWKEMVAIGGKTAHGFSFRVKQSDSRYSLTGGLGSDLVRTVGFHGTVYIEEDGYSVRHVSIEADDIPPSFPIQQSAISVDYDLVAIGDHDYMLPSSAEILVRMGKKNLTKNEIVFRDYRRFGAKSTIQYADPNEK